MTYSAGRTIYDADSHVMETREWLDPFMDADLRSMIRPIYGKEPGRIDKLLDQAKARKGAGAFDPSERARVLDQFGFSGQLVFGTSALSPVLAAKDEGIRYAGMRAYND